MLETLRMSSGGVFRHAAELLAGRWQVPLALLATVAAAVTLLRLAPVAAPVDAAAVLADARLLEDAGDLAGAADALADVLRLQPPTEAAARGALRATLARLSFELARATHPPAPDLAARVVTQQLAAWAEGVPREPRAALRVALARAWAGDDLGALADLRGMLAETLDPDLRRSVVQSAVRILARHPGLRDERRGLLEQLLSDPALQPPQLWWGLQQVVQDALAEHDLPRAEAALAQHADTFANSDLKGYLRYLEALVLFHAGRLAEALPAADWVSEWLEQEGRTTPALDANGHLPTLNRWLIGRIHLAEDRPQEALSAIDAALESGPDAELRLPLMVGRCAALTALGQEEAALAEYRRARLRLAETRDVPPGLRTEYEQTLASCVQRLVNQFTRELPVRSAGGEPARARLEQAAHEWEAAAELTRDDEEQFGLLTLAAASAYDAAGRPEDQRRMLEVFLAGRSRDPRMPTVLLQLGQACEAAGDSAAALEVYRRLITGYPRIEEAARARVLRGGLLMALGPESYAEAEAELLGLLDDDSVAPEALVYRDGLLTLCELLRRAGRFGEAIGRLESFLSLYPRDAEVRRARFMLAEAYRASGMQLLALDAAAAQAEGRARLRTAAEQFERLLDELTTGVDEEQTLYAQLASFSRADCLRALDEPEALVAALAGYREAAARFAGEPAALAAQVRMAEIHLRLGEMTDAARALEKARWLARGIPDEAYARAGGVSREGWERYLETMAASDLFREARADAR